MLCCAIPILAFTDPVFCLLLTTTVISLFAFFELGGWGEDPQVPFPIISFPSAKKEEDPGFLLNTAYTSLKVLRSRFIFRLYSIKYIKLLEKTFCSINYTKLIDKTLNFVSYHYVWNQTNKADEQKFKSVSRVIACLWTIWVFLQNILVPLYCQTLPYSSYIAGGIKVWKYVAEMKLRLGKLLPLKLRHMVCRIRHYRKIQVFPCFSLIHSTNFTTIWDHVILHIHMSS